MPVHEQESDGCTSRAVRVLITRRGDDQQLTQMSLLLARYAYTENNYAPKEARALPALLVITAELLEGSA